MPLQLDDLQLLDSALPTTSGAPLLLPVDAIDEDPGQPRREFDEAALTELAATIAERGVRQPVSVRRHPECADRWMLNFGARRLRASRLAGKSVIPAFIDETADSYDQIIENEQREALGALDLALFVQRRIAAGESQADIARRLGKSRQYVTLATALIDAPDCLIGVYRDGRCRGLTELYELRRLHQSHPEQVQSWLSAPEPLTRERVSALRSILQPSATAVVPCGPPAAAAAAAVAIRKTEGVPGDGASSQDRLEVQFEGATFELVVDQVPESAGEVFIRRRKGDARRAVPASSLTLLGFAAR